MMHMCEIKSICYRHFTRRTVGNCWGVKKLFQQFMHHKIWKGFFKDNFSFSFTFFVDLLISSVANRNSGNWKEICRLKSATREKVRQTWPARPWLWLRNKWTGSRLFGKEWLWSGRRARRSTSLWWRSSLWRQSSWYWPRLWIQWLRRTSICVRRNKDNHVGEKCSGAVWEAYSCTGCGREARTVSRQSTSATTLWSH